MFIFLSTILTFQINKSYHLITKQPTTLISKTQKLRFFTQDIFDNDPEEVIDEIHIVQINAHYGLKLPNSRFICKSPKIIDNNLQPSGKEIQLCKDPNVDGVWKIEEVGGGFFKIIDNNENLCFSVGKLDEDKKIGGYIAETMPCSNGNEKQMFAFINIDDEVTEKEESDGEYEKEINSIEKKENTSENKKDPKDNKEDKTEKKKTEIEKLEKMKSKEDEPDSDSKSEVKKARIPKTRIDTDDLTGINPDLLGAPKYPKVYDMGDRLDNQVIMPEAEKLQRRLY